jgi:hypothetical protein
MLPTPIHVRRFSAFEAEQSAVDKVIGLFRVFIQMRAKLYLGVGGGLALALGYAWYKESEGCISREMLNVFESGGAPDDIVAELVERPTLVADLQTLLKPDLTDHLYYVVIGDEGTGKSTVIRAAIRSLASPKAVVYCEVRSSLDFVGDLAKIVGYRPSFSLRARFWRWMQGEDFKAPVLTWGQLQSKLASVAKIASKPLVIVLDSADRLFEEDPEFFSKLQRDAKAGADHGSPIYVFVLTKGRGLTLLRSHSEWSRAALPFEVQDVSNDQAVKVLLAKHDTMKPEDADAAVQTITGGRFHLLYSFPDSKFKSIEEYRSELFVKTNTALINASLSPTHPFFAHLSASTSKCIPGDTAASLLEQGQLSELLEKKILSVRSDGSYAFNSRHVETFFAGECWRFFFCSCLACASVCLQFVCCCRCVRRNTRTGVERLTQVCIERWHLHILFTVAS